MHKGAGAEGRGLGGTPGLVSTATVQAMVRTQAERPTLGHEPAFLTCIEFRLCTVHDTIFYTLKCLMLFMQRRKSPYITLEKYVYAVLIRALPHQFCVYQRCSQLHSLSKRATNTLTLCRLHRKHLYSTRTFWKQQQQQK